MKALLLVVLILVALCSCTEKRHAKVLLPDSTCATIVLDDAYLYEPGDAVQYQSYRVIIVTIEK